VAPRLRCSCELWLQLALVVGLWIVMLADAPMFFLAAYLPGWAAGLCLCAIHGYYEHAHGTTSHYGRLYNLLLFNDGYHVEHHANPVAHWTQLPSHLKVNARTSRWPAPMRWLESDGLIALEHVALRLPAIQRFLLRCHERALRRLLPELQPFVAESPRIAIVGGGLFPRTAIVLQRLWPSARLIVIDCDASHLDTARRWPDLGPIEFVHDRFPPGAHATSAAFDVVVLPLSFEGSRDALYLAPPARVLLVHDWLWRPRGSSRVVSTLLLKRLNFVHV
jgi:hypothetical protein